MKHNKWQWVLVAGGALVMYGCGDNSDSANTPAESDASQVSTTAPANGIASPAYNAAQATAGAVAAATAQARAQADAAVVAAKAKAQAASDAATAKAKALLATAQPLLDQALTYIKDNKLDLADTALLKIESMNGLPVSFLSKVKDARSLIDAKRKADKAKDVGSTLKGLLGS